MAMPIQVRVQWNLPPSTAAVSPAQKMLYLLEHPDKARSMGAAGRAMIAGFDINEMVRAQERLYRELAGNP